MKKRIFTRTEAIKELIYQDHRNSKGKEKLYKSWTNEDMADRLNFLFDKENIKVI